jgi:transposase
MAMIGKVKRIYFREKKSVREIVRLTSLSRNTVRKWLKAPVLEEPKYRRNGPPGKLTPFAETLKLALKADAHRPRHERRTARALFTQIGSEGYAGSYSSLTDFVRVWRQGEGQSVSAKAFVPLVFELGEAFQFDWSEEGLMVGGIYYRMQVSHLKLCSSRAFWLVAYPSQGHEMLFDAHTRSFAAMGGIARRGIYDNMKTAVNKVKKGKGRTVNKRFAVMCGHYLFDADFCNVASGWEKGQLHDRPDRSHGRHHRPTSGRDHAPDTVGDDPGRLGRARSQGEARPGAQDVPGCVVTHPARDRRTSPQPRAAGNVGLPVRQPARWTVQRQRVQGDVEPVDDRLCRGRRTALHGT